MKAFLVVLFLGALATTGARYADASSACGTAAFPLGAELPEPSDVPQVAARIFTLSSGTGASVVHVGTVYETKRGDAYFMAETGDVAPHARAIEISFLEAAGYEPSLARQYTHLTEIPAVPRVSHPFDLARRLGLVSHRCA